MEHYHYYTTGALPKKTPEVPTFSEFFKHWADGRKTGRRQYRLTYDVIIKITGKRLSWDDIDSSLYLRLLRAFDARGFRPNYQGALIGRLKTCLSHAYDLHYLTNTDFTTWKTPKEKTFAVVLSDSEIKSVEEYRTDNAVLARTRDMFILGLYTAARFSDYSRLTIDCVHDGKLRFVQRKTDNPVVIPCSPKVREILERYGGRAPHMVLQVFNRNIKELCKNIGMTYQVQVPRSVRTKLHKREDDPVYKWELVSSHTCRRTAISKLYREGVPVGLICKVSGHKSEKQLLEYVKITADEVADQLAGLDYFK